MSERKAAERKVGLARWWARAKQVVTTDPTRSDDDDAMVDEEAARVLAAQAGRLKGGLAKVAQLTALTASGGQGRQALAALWDSAPAIDGGAIARVIEAELGKPPQQLFERWDATPIAAASLGQVHAARTHDGAEVVVKVQYPGVADALRADLDDAAFMRKLAGARIGGHLEAGALAALAQAVRGELDYRAEAAMQTRSQRAWDGDPVVRVPRVVEDLSSERVLTSERAFGRSIVEVAGAGDLDVRRAAATAVFRFAWGSPLVHGLLNADANPGNFLVENHARVWCLDFGCSIEIPREMREADLEIWYGLCDLDSERGAERFRLGLHRAGLLARPDSLATTAHRDWERALAAPLATHGDFAWNNAYARELAESTERVLAAGGVELPGALLLLWRQRLGAAATIALLDARVPFRRVLVDLIGSGKRALR